MKIPKIRVTLLTGLSILLLTGCGNQSSQTANQNSNGHHPAPLPQEYMAQQNHRLQNEAGEQVRMHEITQSLKHSYHKLFNVSYHPNRNEIVLLPENKDVKNLIKYADKKNKSAIKNWRQFVNGVKVTSKSVTKTAHSKTAKLVILHPKHHYKIYVAENGKAMYNHYK